ncbi:MAG: polysaccharide biosynthesis C-terminal domain-containing protein [Planctomycetota bacterium]
MLKNVGSNWTLNGLQILIFLVLGRFIIDRFGLDQTGVWGAIVAVLGPLQLLVLGVPMAAVRFVSGHIAKEEYEDANRVLATCLAVLVTMGVVALAAAGALYAGFSAGTSHWELSAAQVADARAAFAVMSLHVAVGFALMLPYGVFAAHQDFVVRNLIMAGGLLLRLGLTLGLLTWRPTLVALASVQITVAAAEFLAAVVVSRRRHPKVRLSLRGVDRALLRPIFTFSGFAMLLNIGALLAFRLDAIVIGANMDESAIAIYDYGNKIFEPFLNIVLAIGMVVMPMATRLEAQGKTHELAPILRKWTKVASCAVFLIGLWLLVLGPAFLRWWVEDEYRPAMADVLRVLVVSFLAFLPVRGVALPMLMGMGRQSKPALALLAMGVINLVLSLALVDRYGVIGVALGTSIPNFLFAAYVLSVAIRTIGADTRRVLVDGFVRPLIGAAVPALLLYGVDSVRPIDGFFPLLASGLAYVGVFAAVQVVFVWRGDPDMDLWARVRGRLKPA